jgi:hypothetical protein
MTAIPAASDLTAHGFRCMSGFPGRARSGKVARLACCVMRREMSTLQFPPFGCKSLLCRAALPHGPYGWACRAAASSGPARARAAAAAARAGA